jgi:transposase-like protein
MTSPRLISPIMDEIIEELRNERIKSCRFCHSGVKISTARQDEVICTWKGCKKRRNIWDDSIFYNIKVPKSTIILDIDLWMQKSSFGLISRMTGLDLKSIWRIMIKVSGFLVPAYYNNFCKIGGNDVIVEVDESKFGKRKYNKGHKVEGVWVLGMVERTQERRIKLIAVDNRNSETLTEKLTSSIYTDSVLYSDGWKGYKKLLERFTGHLTVNHSLNYVDPETGCHTNTIEGNWSGIKLHIPHRGRTKDKIDLFLVRFMILRNEKCDPLEAVIKYIF